MNTKNPNLNTNIFGSFGEALRTTLKNRGLKQKFLVQKAHKGADEISRYVNDKVVPQQETQDLLGSVLGVEFEQLPDGRYAVRSQNEEEFNTPLGNQVNEKILKYIAEAGKGSADNPHRPVLSALRDQLESQKAMFDAQMKNIDSMLVILDTLVQKNNS